MKVATINATVGILSGVKLNKISDKKVKTTLVNDYLYLRRIVKQAQDDRRELTEKFQDDWKDELSAVEALRRENKPVEGHDEYIKAEKDANESIDAIFQAETEVEVKQVPMDDFLSALGGEELTIEQVAFLRDEGGIIC